MCVGENANRVKSPITRILVFSRNYFFLLQRAISKPPNEKCTIIGVQALKVEEKMNFNIMLPQFSVQADKLL